MVLTEVFLDLPVIIRYLNWVPLLEGGKALHTAPYARYFQSPGEDHRALLISLVLFVAVKHREKYAR